MTQIEKSIEEIQEAMSSLEKLAIKATGSDVQFYQGQYAALEWLITKTEEEKPEEEK